MAATKFACILTRLVTTFALLGEMAANAHAQTGYYHYFSATPSFTRPGHSDYAPTAFLDNGQQRVWWCGDGPAGQPGSNIRGDTIYYDENPNTRGVPMPMAQLGWNPKYGNVTNVACAPTVVRPVKPISGFSYLMFYECSTASTGTFSNVCVAAGPDGYTWNVWDGSNWSSSAGAVAVPIIASPGAGSGVDPKSYGNGHPSAIVDDATGLISLYFYQELGGEFGGLSQVCRVQTFDGVHIVTSLLLPCTNLSNAVHIYQLDTYLGTHPYIAVFGTSSSLDGTTYAGNYYLLSNDGLIFEPPVLNPVLSANPLAGVQLGGDSYAGVSGTFTPIPCSMSRPAILSNVHGHIRLPWQKGNPFVLYSAEGRLQGPASVLDSNGKPLFPSPDANANFADTRCWETVSYAQTELVRGSTWDIYPITGTFDWY